MTRRPRGLKLIIAYKFVKAPVMLGIAAALTFAPASTDLLLRHAIAQLSEWGALAYRVAHWLWTHTTPDLETKAAVLAWLDGVSTAVEGALLWSGRVWGEWLVVIGLALLIPFEVALVAHHAGLGRIVALVVNVAIVVYLAARRVQAHRSAAARAEPPTKH